MKLPALLRRADPVDTLNAQLSPADEDGREALARIEALTSERNRLLIDGSDEDVAGVEAEMDCATRDLERAKARRIEANRRLAAEQQRQRDAALDAIHQRGLAAQRKAADLLRGEYAEHARALAELARKLEALDGEIADANHRLTAEGDPRRIEPPDTVARPPAALKVIPVPVYRQLVLPHPDDAALMLHPPGRDIFGSLAPKRDREAA